MIKFWFKLFLACSINLSFAICFAQPTIDSFKKQFKIASGPYLPSDFMPSQQRASHYENEQSDRLWQIIASNGANMAMQLLKNNGDIEGYLNMVIEHRKFIEPLRGDRVGLLRTYNTGFQTYVNQHRYWEYEAKFLSKHIGNSEDSNVTKTYIYKDINGVELDAGSFQVMRYKVYRSVVLYHPPDPTPILKDVLLRFKRLVANQYKGTENEKYVEFYRALWGLYVSCPYYRGTAAIGKIMSAGLYYSIFKKKMPIHPDGIDLEAFMSATPEEFADMMIRYTPIDNTFHKVKPPSRQWYYLVPTIEGLTVYDSIVKNDEVIEFAKFKGVDFYLTFTRTNEGAMLLDLPVNSHLRISTQDLLPIVLALGARAAKKLNAATILIPHYPYMKPFDVQMESLMSFAVSKDWGVVYGENVKGTILLDKADIEYFNESYLPLEESRIKRANAAMKCVDLFK